MGMQAAWSHKPRVNVLELVDIAVHSWPTLRTDVVQSRTPFSQYFEYYAINIGP